MSGAQIYLACFVLGITFVSVAGLAGHFGGGDHGGDHGHIGHDAQGGHDGGLPLPLFSPAVLAVFIGMLGAGGLLALQVLHWTRLWMHLSTAIGASAVSGVSVAWTMMKLVQHGESNSLGSHAELVGRDVEVIVPIRGTLLGEITYDAGGSRQTLLARTSTPQSFSEGSRVQVLAVENGVASVGPAHSTPSAPATGIGSTGMGVPTTRGKTRR